MPFYHLWVAQEHRAKKLVFYKIQDFITRYLIAILVLYSKIFYPSQQNCLKPSQRLSWKMLSNLNDYSPISAITGTLAKSRVHFMHVDT